MTSECQEEGRISIWLQSDTRNESISRLQEKVVSKPSTHLPFIRINKQMNNASIKQQQCVRASETNPCLCCNLIEFSCMFSISVSASQAII